MRETPTALEQSGTASDYAVLASNTTKIICDSVPSFVGPTTQDMAVVEFSASSGLSTGDPTFGRSNTTSAFLAWSAEL